MNLTKLKAMAEFDEGAAHAAGLFPTAEAKNSDDLFEEGALYQHTKDKALIDLLMRIVVRMDETLHLIKIQREGFAEEFFQHAMDNIADSESDVAKLIEEAK